MKKVTDESYEVGSGYGFFLEGSIPYLVFLGGRIGIRMNTTGSATLNMIQAINIEKGFDISICGNKPSKMSNALMRSN